MQNPIIKRRASIVLENYSLDDPTRIYQEPRKKFKPSLSIEIHDPFSESTSNKYLLQQKTSNSTSFTPKHSINFLNFPNDKFYQISKSPCNKKDVTPSSRSEMSPKYEIDRQYDDYYFEEECFNISMQKCNRKTMEDRVIL